MASLQKWQVLFQGRVQGVGFRYTVHDIAKDYQVTGWVRNRHDGQVELVCEGELKELQAFVDAIIKSRVGQIEHHQVVESEATDEFQDFSIRR